MPQGTSIRAAVVGSTGYIGMQCTALLAGHPDVELTRLLCPSRAGQRSCDVVPGSPVQLTVEDTPYPRTDDFLIATLPYTVSPHPPP